jgi:hypothetical protein
MLSTIAVRENGFPALVRFIGYPIFPGSSSRQNALMAWPSAHFPKAWSPSIIDFKKIVEDGVLLRANNAMDRKPHKLFVKNMVSARCRMIVKLILNDLRLEYFAVGLGEIELKEPLAPKQQAALKAALATVGLELMDDGKSILAERIKNVIVEMVHYVDGLPVINYSDYISKKLDHNYTYLANLFVAAKGLTIQQCIILQRIERVKELISYGELSFSEIAWKLQYSSVAHLSNQFKKVTGMTFSDFKKMNLKRAHLEDL